MDLIRRETYAIPVYSFDDPDEWDEDANRPESDEDDRIIVSLNERQTGPPDIRVVVKRRDERAGEYNFRVTDADLYWCAYRGEDAEAVPIHVLHAVHEFGYGVENIATLGQWFTDRWEAQEVFSNVLRLLDEIEEPILHSQLNDTSYLIDMLNTILIVRYGTDAETFDALWEEFRATHSEFKPDGFELAPMKEFFWTAAEDNDLNYLLGDTDGTTELKMGVEFLEFEAENGTHLGVDIATDFGIERYLFHKQNEDTCAYVGGRQSSRPNPEVVLTLQVEEEYNVVNAETVATADSAAEVMEYGLLLVEDLQNRDGFVPDDETHPLAVLLEGIHNRLFTLFQLFVVHECDPEAYRSQSQKVLNHLDVSSDAVGSVSHSAMMEILAAIVRLLGDDVNEAATRRIRDSPVYTEEVGEAMGILDED